MQCTAHRSGEQSARLQAMPGGRLFRVLTASLLLLYPASGGFAGETISEVPVRGVVRSLNQSTLSTNIRAKVSSISRRQGEHFTTGEALVTFDCRAEQARLTAARALSKEKAVSLKSAKYLQGLKAGSTQDVQIAEAQFEQAQAEVDAISATLDGCVITAPFDGAVHELHVRENERPSDGAPIVSIVDTQSSEIELIVSSNWIRDIVPGRRFKFRIDETGETETAIILRTAPVVDSVSQTIRVYAAFAEPATSVLPGMSGEATFDLDWQLR